MLAKPYTRIKDRSGKLLRDEFRRYKYRLKFRLAGRGSKIINRLAWLKDDLAAAAMVAELRSDAAAISPLYSWDSALALFLKSKESSTTERYRHDVTVAVAYIVKNCSPIIEKTSLAAYSAALRQKSEDASPRRANNIRCYTLAVARFARSEGMIARLPFEYSAPRPDKKEGRAPFPIDHFRAYYDALDIYAKPLLLALATTGERITAICGINLDNVDYAREIVRVTKKGGKSRDIPFSPMLVEALSQALALQVERTSAGSIFVNRTGTRWNMCSFRRNAERAWQKANLPWFPIHSLRNLAASILADANASRDAISASLGHEQSATADLYLRARDMLKSATFGQRTLSDAISDQMRRTGDAPRTKNNPNSDLKAPENRNEKTPQSP